MKAMLMGLAAAIGIVAVSLGGLQAQAPTRSPLPLPNPYRVDESFTLEMPPGLKSLGSVTAVKVAADNNLYVFHRCVLDSCASHDAINPILVYSPQGKLLEQMGAGQFTWPHGLFVMPDLTFWTADAVAPPADGAPRRGQQVFHHDKNGAVVMALGQPGVPGVGRDTLSRPSDVAIGRNGDIYVADGHGGRDGARIVKFNSRGEYVTECGGAGTGPGQIMVPHGLAIDSQGRLFVADRNNSRLNIYDANCRFLMEWRQFGRPTSVAIDRNDIIYVTDTQTTVGRPGFQNGIYIGSATDGTVTGFIPKITPRSKWEVDAAGGGTEAATNMESIGVAPDGSAVYGGEVGLLTVIKFVRK